MDNDDENQWGISSLTIGFNGFDGQVMDCLGDFFVAIGPSLKVLALDATRIDIDVSFILQRCPNLEQLSLRSLVADVRFDFKEFHASNQPLHNLNWGDVVTIATELEDVHSPLYKSLRRLRVRLNNVRDARGVLDEAGIKSSVAELIEMIKVNQSLEYLDIVALVNTSNSSMTSECSILRQLIGQYRSQWRRRARFSVYLHPQTLKWKYCYVSLSDSS